LSFESLYNKVLLKQQDLSRTEYRRKKWGSADAYSMFKYLKVENYFQESREIT